MTPRVHGNQFIQLDLTDTTRLHIWGDPRIPKQRVSTPIHSHVFDFTSKVLKGRLIHIEYNLSWFPPAGTFWKFNVIPREGDDTELVNSGNCCNIAPYDTKVILKGQQYTFTTNRFHENFAPEPTVTIIEKSGPTLTQNKHGPKPGVLVPIGIEPDNEFCRHSWDKELLWDIIEENIEGLDIKIERD